MKIQNIMAVLGVAAATMAFTLGLAASSQVDAVDQEENVSTRITPLIRQPTLNISGLEIKLAMDQPNYAAGDKPVVTLEASNPTNQRVQTNLSIGMTASSIASRLSRAPTMPSYFWSEDVPLALEPGESRQIKLATQTELVAGKSLAVTMSDLDQSAALAKVLILNGGARGNSRAATVAPATPDSATAAVEAANRIGRR